MRSRRRLRCASSRIGSSRGGRGNEIQKNGKIEAIIITPPDYLGNVMKLCDERRGIQKKISYLSKTRVLLEYELPLAEVVGHDAVSEDRQRDRQAYRRGLAVRGSGVRVELERVGEVPPDKAQHHEVDVADAVQGRLGSLGADQFIFRPGCANSLQRPTQHLVGSRAQQIGTRRKQFRAHADAL